MTILQVYYKDAFSLTEVTVTIFLDNARFPHARITKKHNVDHLCIFKVVNVNGIHSGTHDSKRNNFVKYIADIEY